jgi:hypothetical protein
MAGSRPGVTPHRPADSPHDPACGEELGRRNVVIQHPEKLQRRLGIRRNLAEDLVGDDRREARAHIAREPVHL